MKLGQKELISLSGGGFSLAASIGAAIAFLISMVDGFLNPIRCINDIGWQGSFKFKRWES